MERKNIKSFPKVKKALIEKYDYVDIWETKYSAKARYHNEKEKPRSIIFSKDSFCPFEMSLINKVKTDTKTFIQEVMNGEVPDKNLNDIDFLLFFEDVDVENYQKCVKIDLNSAYWTLAMKQHVVSDKTNNYLQENIKNFRNGEKQARLKALGSLATRKVLTSYRKGKQIWLKHPIQVNDYTRNIYIDICDQTDATMKIIASLYPKNVIYYYWDCIFLVNYTDEIIKDAVRYIQEELGIKCKWNETIINIDYNGKNGVLTDVKKNIEYPITKNKSV